MDGSNSNIIVIIVPLPSWDSVCGVFTFYCSLGTVLGSGGWEYRYLFLVILSNKTQKISFNTAALAGFLRSPGDKYFQPDRTDAFCFNHRIIVGLRLTHCALEVG
jgi:hypothetical protein